LFLVKVWCGVESTVDRFSLTIFSASLIASSCFVKGDGCLCIFFGGDDDVDDDADDDEVADLISISSEKE